MRASAPRPDVVAAATVAVFVTLTIGIAAQGRSFAVAVVAALTLLAVVVLPLSLLMAILGRRSRRGGPRGGPGGGREGGVEASESPDGWVPSRTFDKAESALRRGEVWRAKEILQGTLASQPYHPELYERYGRVLLDMGDLLEAGKYLFLSGRRDAAYDAAIDIFLDRFRDKDAGELVRVLPSRARDVDRLPGGVVDELERMGWQPRELRKARPGYRGGTAGGGSWLDHAAVTVGALVFLTVAVLGVAAFFDLLRETGAS